MSRVTVLDRLGAQGECNVTCTVGGRRYRVCVYGCYAPGSNMTARGWAGFAESHTDGLGWVPYGPDLRRAWLAALRLVAREVGP